MEKDTWTVVMFKCDIFKVVLTSELKPYQPHLVDHDADSFTEAAAAVAFSEEEGVARANPTGMDQGVDEATNVAQDAAAAAQQCPPSALPSPHTTVASSAAALHWSPSSAHTMAPARAQAPAAAPVRERMSHL